MAFDETPLIPTPAPGPVDVDVAICGGGFAGLTLARQLRIENPGVSVAVIDKLTRPLPEAGFKVGESTVELAAHYLRDKLGLAEMLDRSHYRKMGLRYFFQAPEGQRDDFSARPEYGLSTFATIPTHQIDRGVFEEELRGMIEADGVRLIEGARIDEIALGEGGAAHRIDYYHDAAGDARQSLTARWVVDASGRRRTLQRQLGLSKQREADHHAVWFRVEGIVNIDGAVPGQTGWHDRVPGGKRFHATTHLVDKGYWVWIIPLATGHTSVGIVATKDYHPFEEVRSRELALEWLGRHEPHFARLLTEGDHEMIDFGAIRNYSHTSGQVFSGDRWACTGDAGVFSDPMYSPGADLISFANCCISWMVGQDMEGRLTPAMAEEKSKFVISIGELLTRSIQVNYHLLGQPATMAGKLFWDITAGWAVVQPLMYSGAFLDSDRHKAVRAAGRNFFFMSLQMNTLFTDWAKMSKGNIAFDFIDYFKIDAIREMRERNLVPGKPMEELIADQHENMGLMEELAIALFRIAVADVCPEHLHRIEGRWLNATGVSLDPSTWEARGLFEPKSAPRDTARMEAQLREAFGMKVLEEV